MAATKYQVLYRYINEATNTPITNSMDNAYEETCEFYTDPDHKIFSQDTAAQFEAVDEQQEMISYGNSAENPKNNMLFAYNGTKKIKHKKWIDETTGYVVRDWEQIQRSRIGNQGDFTKEFTTIEAATPEDGGIVICTKEVMQKYFPDTETISVTTSGEYTSDEMWKMITESTFFALDPDLKLEDYTKPSNVASTYYYNSPSSYQYYTGPIAIDTVIGTVIGYGRYNTSPNTFKGNLSPAGLYSSVTVKNTQLKTVQIPGHYEDVTDAPYAIKDTYKRIQLSPWFVNTTTGSLETALKRVKTLADMLGIDNVKLIKIVPFDQFIKIR